MAHTTLKTSYSSLADRLNRFPQGAPPSKLLFKILAMLFSEKEASLVSLLPIKPFTAKKASRLWKMNLNETQKVLDTLAGRAILVDIEQNGPCQYRFVLVVYFSESYGMFCPRTGDCACKICGLSRTMETGGNKCQIR